MISSLLYTLEYKRLQEQIKNFFALSRILYSVQITPLHPTQLTALSALVVNKNLFKIIIKLFLLITSTEMIAAGEIGNYNWN
ncbi:MAG: hypothetical protein DRN68_08350 [Thaumarchaeota archaeon]|nr:MAG: hypothetical protein DRN68_08350 [Nitrososphaerota archaeon]